MRLLILLSYNPIYSLDGYTKLGLSCALILVIAIEFKRYVAIGKPPMGNPIGGSFGEGELN